MNVSSQNCSIEGRVVNTHCPLVPNLGLGVVAPDANADLLAFEDDKRFFNREVHWEPTMHAWGVSSWVCAI